MTTRRSGKGPEAAEDPPGAARTNDQSVGEPAGHDRSSTPGRARIEETTVAALQPDPANRRLHTDRNLAMITASLREVGAGRSIVIDEMGEVLAGNGVVAAAGGAGLTK